MRRNEIDILSQPVRNLFTNPQCDNPAAASTFRTNLAQNPSFETTSGTVDVRTNLHTNPAFEATVGTSDVRTNWIPNSSFAATSGTVNVRTNLAANPAMEIAGANQSVRSNLAVNPKMTNSNFGGYGSQTLSNATGVTGNPELITTAVRTAYVASAANPGVIVMRLPDVNTQYTVSAWVYNEGTVVENIAIALMGVSSGGQQSVQPGIWTRLSWTLTTPASLLTGNDFGVRISTPSANGSFLTTGVLIEKAPILGAYFDGTTPAYENLAKTATTPLSGVTITTGISYAGSTWSRAAVVAGTGGWIARQYAALADLVNGETYTAAVTVANDTAFPVGIAQDWCDTGGGSYTIQPGETRRIKVTGSKATYSDVYRFSDLQVNQDASGPRSILFKDWVIEQGSTDGKYFAGTGDFTYVWTGAVNASASLQQAPTLATWSAQTTGASKIYQTTRDAVSGKSAAIYKNGGYVFLNASLTGLQASTSYTFSYDVVSPVATIATVDRGLSGGGYAPLDKTVTPGVVTRVNRTFVTGAGETTRLISLAGWESAMAPDGSLMVVDNLLIELSTLAQSYFDGSTAASGDFTFAWAGTANASVSYQQAPILASWLNRWFGSTGGAGVLYQAKGGPSGTYARKLWTVANTGAPMDTGLNTGNITAWASTTYTLSAWVRCSVDQVYQFYIDWKDSGTTLLTSSRPTQTAVIPANTWTRLSITSTSPANTAMGVFVIGPYTGALPMPAGATMDFANVMAEIYPSVREYFDVSSPIRNLCSNPSFESSLGTWNQVSGGSVSRDTTQGFVGTACAKITVANTVDGAYFAGGAGDIVAGTTVTTSAYVKVPSGQAFRFDTDTSTDGSGWIVSNTTTHIGTGNWQRVSHTTVMPAGAIKVAVGFKSNAPWAGTILVDAILIENGTTLNEYYEGQGGFTYAWAGAANLSASVQQAPRPATVGSANQAVIYQVGTPGKYKTRASFIGTTIGDSGINFGGGIITGANKTYTVGMTVTADTTRTFKFSAQGAGVIPSGTAAITATAGVPTRQVFSFTTSASGTFALYILRADTLLGNIDIQDMQVEEGTMLNGGYFNGTKVEQNLFANSNFETNASGWWPNSGTPTLTSSAEAAFLGTKSLKAVSTVVGSDIAVTHSVTLKPLTTYTMSYYVYSPDARTACYFDVSAANFNMTRLGSISVPANVWKRVSATFTTPENITGSAAFYLHQSGGPNVSGAVVFIDAVLLEESDTLNQFYEGTGDFTYAWTGTAHASTSVQRGVAVSRVSNERAFGISTTRNGDKVVRVIPAVKGAAGVAAYTGPDVFVGLWNQPPSLKINTTYTAMVTYQNEAPLSAGGKLRFNIDGDQSSPAFNTAVGEYTMHWTFTTGATAAIQFMRFMPGPSGVAGYTNEVIFKNLMIVEGAYVGPYFDGATTAGDYTYRWTGAANDSMSELRATPPLKVGWLNAIPATSTDWSSSGTKSVRVSPSGASTDSFAYLTIPALENGKTYTVMATLRMTAPQTGTIDIRARRIDVFHSNGYTLGPQAPNVAGVSTVRATFKMTDKTAYTNVRLYNGASVGNGDVWYDNIMLVEGDYSGDFINPTQNPLAKWDGTVSDSTSIGYPPQFLDIAGKPAAELIGATGDTGNILAPDPFAARTVYFVYEHTDMNFAWQAPFYYGRPIGGGAEGVTFQTSDVGVNNLSPRADFLNGSQNAGTSLSGGRSSGRHVIVMAVPQGIGSAKFMRNGGTDVQTTYANPAQGWSSGRLNAISRNGIVHLRSFVFYAEHDRATRVAMSRYLGNKYGASVA